MTLQYPFPVYGIVTGDYGLPITDRPVFVRVRDTRPGFAPIEMQCDNNGYYQINIQSKIQNYGMDCQVEAFYYANNPVIVSCTKYFTVIKADIAKEIDFEMPLSYYMTDKKYINIEVI